LIWSKSDGLPGVVVDRYGDQVDFPERTPMGMDRQKGESFQALINQFNPSVIVERNEGSGRVAEGLPR